MKVWLRFIANMGVGLLMSAVSFGQHYNQNNLVSSVSGVAPVTDSGFINTWGLARAAGGPMVNRRKWYRHRSPLQWCWRRTDSECHNPAGRSDQQKYPDRFANHHNLQRQSNRFPIGSR